MRIMRRSSSFESVLRAWLLFLHIDLSSLLQVRWIRAMYSDFEVFRRDQEMLISEMEDQLHTFDYIEGFVVMNNQDPICNGLKSVPFSLDADQAVKAMSSNMLPATATSSVLYYLEAAVGYNLADVGPASSKERKNTTATSRRPQLISFCSS